MKEPSTGYNYVYRYNESITNSKIFQAVTFPVENIGYNECACQSKKL